MTIEADNALGCGQRLNFSSYNTADELGVAAAKVPASGVNIAKVSAITIVDRVSINSETNDVEVDETNGNTLFQVDVQAVFSFGEVTGTSDEIEDFNGILAGGYHSQAVTLDDDDCQIAASAVAAMAVGGYINAADVMKRVCLEKLLSVGVCSAVDGSFTAISGATDESTS